MPEHPLGSAAACEIVEQLPVLKRRQDSGFPTAALLSGDTVKYSRRCWANASPCSTSGRLVRARRREKLEVCGAGTPYHERGLSGYRIRSGRQRNHLEEYHRDRTKLRRWLPRLPPAGRRCPSDGRPALADDPSTGFLLDAGGEGVVGKEFA